MDKELKAKWVAALRSGKYQQTKGTLHSGSDGGYCCLGVLLDVSGRGNWRGQDFDLEGDDGKIIFCAGDIGRSACHALDIPPDQEEKLIGMNDGAQEPQRTFTEIADYIEATL